MSHKHFTDYDAPGAAATFEAEHFGNDVGRFLHETELEKIRSLIDDRDASVADIGTGSGRLAIPLARDGHSVVAVDASREMLNVARAKAGDLENLVFEQGDAHALAFDAQQFDFTVSIRTLMHFERWDVVLTQICRISRRGVIIDVPPTRGAPILEVLYDRLISGRKPYRTFGLGELERIFSANGFEITFKERRFLLPIKLHRLINQLALTNALEGLFRALGLTWLFGAPLLIKAERVAPGA